ncbi:MAG TPA: hypothetical protein VG388_13165 [Solirubrobacteraceae bacterium]|nr:hypothetical protein [Solirubrobacteraceae bacterium]
MRPRRSATGLALRALVQPDAGIVDEDVQSSSGGRIAGAGSWASSEPRFW